MEEKKKIKISLKMTILIIILIFILIAIIVAGVVFFIKNKENNTIRIVEAFNITTIYENMKDEDIPTISNIKYNEEEIMLYPGGINELDNIFVTSKAELEEELYYCIEKDLELMEEKLEDCIELEEYIEKNYDDEFFESYNLAIQMYDNIHHNCKTTSVILDKDYVTINIKDNYSKYSGVFPMTPTIKFIKLNKEIKNVKFDIYRITKDNGRSRDFDLTEKKPVIYLYPTEETEVVVKLKNKENITCSYPEYVDEGWKVIAKPNGDLNYINTGKNLYSLYYESDNSIEFKMENEGFVVKKSEIASFLEEKLSILGLTEREAEEFIIYWLPELQKNEYNYIRFATQDEINKNMPLEFSVEPDTLIRVLMTYKGLDKPIKIKEQKLEKKERIGFVAVEWGGTKIK